MRNPSSPLTYIDTWGGERWNILLPTCLHWHYLGGGLVTTGKWWKSWFTAPPPLTPAQSAAGGAPRSEGKYRLPEWPLLVPRCWLARMKISAPYPISSGICLLRVWAALVLSLQGGSLASPFSLYWHECRWGHRLSVASARVEQLLSVSFLPCEAAPFPVLSQRADFWFVLLPVGVCCQFLQLQILDLWSKREKPQELTPE